MKVPSFILFAVTTIIYPLLLIDSVKKNSVQFEVPMRLGTLKLN